MPSGPSPPSSTAVSPVLSSILNLSESWAGDGVGSSYSSLKAWSSRPMEAVSEIAAMWMLYGFILVLGFIFQMLQSFGNRSQLGHLLVLQSGEVGERFMVDFGFGVVLGLGFGLTTLKCRQRPPLHPAAG